MRRCCACGRRAPTRDVLFYCNVGMVVARMTYTHEGPTCSPCIHSTHWSYTFTTLAIGWLGIISLFIAPCLIIINTFVYCTIWLFRPVTEEDYDD